ncbi:MAG: hypothetical protein U1F42_10150 [Candidatus Competibacteraceae bacterium]
MPASRLASMVLPVPGGPISKEMTTSCGDQRTLGVLLTVHVA